MVLWPVFLAAAETPAQEKLLSPAELAAIDRENAMWRLTRADEEVAANLEILRQAGFTPGEISRIEPKLTELWKIPFERHFGWLTAETVEQIKEIDHNYTARMRAARLRAATGIQIMAPYQATPRQVSAQWHWALLKVLDYDEIAEFRLMNAPAAREVDAWTKDITLSESERRTLNEWQRDFDAIYGRNIAPGMWNQSENNRWRQEARLEFLGRVRELLGDARCEIYLDAMSPAFRRMRDRLDAANAGNAQTALDAWWIREKYRMARADEHRWEKLDELATAERSELTTLLGEDAFARYAKDEEETRWLYPQRIVKRPPQPKVADVFHKGPN